MKLYSRVPEVCAAPVILHFFVVLEGDIFTGVIDKWES